MYTLYVSEILLDSLCSLIYILKQLNELKLSHLTKKMEALNNLIELGQSWDSNPGMSHSQACGILQLPSLAPTLGM